MKIRFLGCFLLFFTAVFSQEILQHDMNGDGIADKVWWNKTAIFCELSGSDKGIIKSKPIDQVPDNISFQAAAGGFYFNVNYMRAGFSVQFRYTEKTGQMETIGMSRYEFGPASNDGSGESSVNLLTHDYIGNWNYFDMKENSLKPVPEIRMKMKLKKETLEQFDGSLSDIYITRCSELFMRRKKELLKKQK